MRLPHTLTLSRLRTQRADRRSRFALGALATLTALALAACSKPEPPDIKFAPYAKSYQTKMSLAQVEYQYPIPPAELAKITPDYLATLDEEQIDQIYARLTAGPIPDGASTGASCSKPASCCRAAAAENSGFPSWLAASVAPFCTSRVWSSRK